MKQNVKKMLRLHTHTHTKYLVRAQNKNQQVSPWTDFIKIQKKALERPTELWSE